MNHGHQRHSWRNTALGVTALATSLALSACDGYGPHSTTVEDTLRAVSFEPPPADPKAISRDNRPIPAATVPLSDKEPSLYLGAGNPQRQSGAQSPQRDDKGVKINFDGVSISEAVKVVLGDILGATYTMAPGISGDVMLSSSAPLDDDELVSMLEMALRMNGATLIRTGHNAYAITPSDKVGGAVETAWLGGPTPPRVAPGKGVTIVPLRYVKASSAAQFVQPLLSHPENMRIDESHNLILFTGSTSERQMVIDTIDEVDVNWMAGRSAGVFPLKVATPDVIIPELEVLSTPFDAGPGAGSTIHFMAMDRLNAILAIANRPEQITDIGRWIERLDRGNVSGIQFFVYQLQHVPAENVAKVLSDTFGEGGELSSGETLIGMTPNAPNVPEEGEFTDTAITTTGLGTTGSRTGNPLKGVRIVPNPLNNTLLIRATPEAYRMIESTLRRLDVAPLQVLIEATIAEVTLNDTLRYGVQYYLDAGAIKAGFNNTTPSTGVIEPNLLNPLARLPGFNLVATPGSSNITIDALARITNVKVLSSPSVVVQDNSEAVLNVGDEVPITTRSAVSVDDPNAPVVNNIEYRDTGVILEVKPRISSNEIVALDISQEVSRVATESTSSDNLTPIISQRKITSHVNVQSGQTVVLGGLIQDATTHSNDKIPMLGDIPMLGALFGSNNNQAVRTELIVFITPRIVRNPIDARDASEEMRSKMRALNPNSLGPVIEHESDPLAGPEPQVAPVANSVGQPRKPVIGRQPLAMDRLPAPRRSHALLAPPVQPAIEVQPTIDLARPAGHPRSSMTALAVARTEPAVTTAMATTATTPAATIAPRQDNATADLPVTTAMLNTQDSRTPEDTTSGNRNASTAVATSGPTPLAISSKEAIARRLDAMFDFTTTWPAAHSSHRTISWQVMAKLLMDRHPTGTGTRTSTKERNTHRPGFTRLADVENAVRRSVEIATTAEMPTHAAAAVTSLAAATTTREPTSPGPSATIDSAPQIGSETPEAAADRDPALDRIKPVRACDIYFSGTPSHDSEIHTLMLRLCNRIS